MQQLSLFDSDDDQQPIAAKSIELFTMQQANRYREMGAQLFCTCSDYPRAQISVVRYSQGAFQVKVAGIDGWITPHRAWAEVTNQALEKKDEPEQKNVDSESLGVPISTLSEQS